MSLSRYARLLVVAVILGNSRRPLRAPGKRLLRKQSCSLENATDAIKTDSAFIRIHQTAALGTQYQSVRYSRFQLLSQAPLERVGIVNHFALSANLQGPWKRGRDGAVLHSAYGLQTWKRNGTRGMTCESCLHD